MEVENGSTVYGLQVLGTNGWAAYFGGEVP